MMNILKIAKLSAAVVKPLPKNYPLLLPISCVYYLYLVHVDNHLYEFFFCFGYSLIYKIIVVVLANTIYLISAANGCIDVLSNATRMLCATNGFG